MGLETFFVFFVPSQYFLKRLLDIGNLFFHNEMLQYRGKIPLIELY